MLTQIVKLNKGITVQFYTANRILKFSFKIQHSKG